MTVYCKLCLIALLVVAVLSLSVLAADDPADVPLRMANGAVIEGTVQKATPDGLVIQGEKGKYTAPWKYLSAGTRYRYELPMLAARALAPQKPQAVAATKESAEKATAAKAAVTKATVTNAVGVVSNMPPANSSWRNRSH